MVSETNAGGNILKYCDITQRNSRLLYQTALLIVTSHKFEVFIMFFVKMKKSFAECSRCSLPHNVSQATKG